MHPFNRDFLLLLFLWVGVPLLAVALDLPVVAEHHREAWKAKFGQHDTDGGGG